MRKTVAWMATFVLIALAIYVLLRHEWIVPVYDTFVSLFSFPGNPVVQIRRPSQLILLRLHVPILAILAAVLALSWQWWRHETRWLWLALWFAYLLRAFVWGIGGDLPIVQGDSAHHFSIARQIVEGNGPTLPYVHSFVRVYPRFGLIDDWSPPAYAFWLAGAMSLFGVTVTVAKAATLVINLATIPLLFHLAKRLFDSRIAVLSAWTLAILPAHVLYASFMLKESLVAFGAVLAVHTFVWFWDDENPHVLLSGIVAGIAAGLLCLSRQTGFAIVAALILYGLMTSITQKIGRLLVFAVVLAAVIAPWGWATYRDYGVPFYSSTNSFKYMTSWPDHFMNRGAPTLNDYLRQPIHQIIRDKCIMLWVIASHFWFVFTPVLALGFVIAVWKRNGGSLGKVGALIFAAFMAGTLVNIAAIDQVKDFGRYFLPVLAVLIPVAWKGVIDYLAQFQSERTSSKRLESVVLVLVVSAFWGALDWTHNYRFLSNDFHERLVLQKLIGEKIAKELPKDAIVMTFYPWEVHMYSGRKTVLMPRNFDPVRLREEVREYGVTHIVFENGVGNRNFPAILKEFHLENRATEIYQQLAKDQIGVYPIREN